MFTVSHAKCEMDDGLQYRYLLNRNLTMTKLERTTCISLGIWGIAFKFEGSERQEYKGIFVSGNSCLDGFPSFSIRYL